MNAPSVAADRAENLAKLACVYAGLVWGVFWIPLRALDDGGITGAWATVLLFVVPLSLGLPIAIWRWRRLVAGGWRLHAIGITAGLSLALYSDALIYTEVIRGMLLYYLTPVWSTLLAYLWLRERITGGRMVAILLGLSGMLLIFGIDLGVPWPRNAGDWMGLASGIVWAVAAVLMHEDRKNRATEVTFVYFLWGTLAAIMIAWAPFSGAHPRPAMDAALATLVWVVPVLLVLVVPATFAFLWGTSRLSPGLVGLLFMTEISVGTVTAALWAGEPFGFREIAGVVLITSAGLVEVIMVPLSRLRRIVGSGRG